VPRLTSCVYQFQTSREEHETVTGIDCRSNGYTCPAACAQLCIRYKENAKVYSCVYYCENADHRGLSCKKNDDVKQYVRRRGSGIEKECESTQGRDVRFSV